MAISLDQSVENSLILQISEGLRQLSVDHDCFVFSSGFSWCDALSELFTPSQLDKLQDYCGEDPIRQFIHGQVAGTMRHTYSYNKGVSNITLTSYPEFSDPVKSSRKIVKNLKQLPYQYRISVQLPQEISKSLDNFIKVHQLSESVWIHPSRSIPDPFPISHNNPLVDNDLFDRFISDDKYDLQPDRTLLSIRASGYVGLYRTPLVPHASDILKAFYGAALAVGLFKYGTSFQNPEDSFFIIHQISKSATEIVFTEAVDSDLTANSCRLRVTPQGDLSDEEYGEKIENLLNAVSCIFGSDKHARKIFTSCVWLFRSHTSFNPLDSLLESTIAIEALLGDRENQAKLGISRLLGNRCAYLLGTSMQEREDIIQQFDGIYQLRSDVVHSGKHRVNSHERKTSELSKSLCARIIRQELILEMKARSKRAELASAAEVNEL